MKKIIIALLILAVLILSGCKDSITGGAIVCNKPYILVGNDCCLDKDDNSICDKDEVEEIIEPVEPPKEEIEEEPIAIEEEEEIAEEIPEESPEEVSTSNEFLIKLGESIKFDKKTITLVSLDNIPEFKAVFDIDGIERDIIGTKNLEIINDVEVTIMEYLNIENSVIVKLEKLALGEDEILVNTRTDIKLFGKEIKINNILDKGEVLLDITDIKTGDNDIKIIIKEGESSIVQGITITNIDGFPKGIKIERYAIIKVQQ